MTEKKERDYVLGTHDEEIERLGLQHRVWRPRVTDAWRLAGFTAGQTLIDIGCGPGYASIDLAEIVGSAGKIVAIDRSRRFLDALEERQRQLGLNNIQTFELDLDEAPLPIRNADGAWSRWVFAFVKNPRALLNKVTDSLKKGGVFVSYEYIDYSTWRVTPRSEAFEEFVRIVMESWRASGGEPDIAMELPLWLGELGFEIKSLKPIVEVTPPTNFLWQWPKAFVDVGIQRLVDIGKISQQQADEVSEAFAKTETTPHALTITPLVLEIIAVRT